MPIKNYTTKIAATKTVGEIQQMLAKAGASSVLIDYEGGEASSVSFAMMVRDRAVSFRLKARPDAILRAMDSDPSCQRSYCNPDQAKRTAWRLVKDWIDVQLAFAEADQAELSKLLLGFSVTSTGEELYEVLVHGQQGQHLLAEHF